MHQEVILGHTVSNNVAPFDEQHAITGLLGQIEVLELGTGSEPINIRMHYRQKSFMSSGEDERRARQLLVDTEPFPHTRSKQSLAGAETTGEQHDVAGTQHRSQMSPERQGLGRGVG